MTTTNADVFTPVTPAAIKRIRALANDLGAAMTIHDQIRALFLLHCACKDVEVGIGRGEVANEEFTR